MDRSSPRRGRSPRAPLRSARAARRKAHRRSRTRSPKRGIPSERRGKVLQLFTSRSAHEVSSMRTRAGEIASGEVLTEEIAVFIARDPDLTRSAEWIRGLRQSIRHAGARHSAREHVAARTETVRSCSLSGSSSSSSTRRRHRGGGIGRRVGAPRGRSRRRLEGSCRTRTSAWRGRADIRRHHREVRQEDRTDREDDRLPAGDEEDEDEAQDADAHRDEILEHRRRRGSRARWPIGDRLLLLQIRYACRESGPIRLAQA